MDDGALPMDFSVTTDADEVRIDKHFPSMDLGYVRPRRDPPVVGNRHAAGGEAGDGVRGERGGVEGGGGHQRSLRGVYAEKLKNAVFEQKRATLPTAAVSGCLQGSPFHRHYFLSKV